MVKIENLEKKYGDFHLNISMEIPKGTVTGLIGKNGTGKSTTIKSILGLIQPDQGKVLVFGKDAAKLTGIEKQGVGVALSNSGFSAYLNVKDVIRILKKAYREFEEEKFCRECKTLGLPFDKNIMDFSTGMKAKLRVLVALSHKAKLLVMDEPTAGLDVEARCEILDLLRNYLTEDEDRSILITSHISSDLEGLCDDIYLIHDGKILLHEETDRILDQYAVLKVGKDLFENMDKSFILKSKKENFGYSCITNQKQYYAENYPGMVIENGKIDDLILMMTGGK